MTTILALPGTLCSPAIFDALAVRLRGVARVDAVSWMTQPGPADIPSIAARLAQRLAETVPPVHVLGHTTGGAIAQQLALEHPELVASLTLVDTGPNMQGHGDVDAIIATIERSWGPELFGAILDRSFAEPLDPALRAAFVVYAESVDRRVASEVLRSQRELDFAPRLVEISCPAVVIHGTLDPTRTVAQAEAFAAGLGAPLHLLPTGHSPMHEAPDAMAEIIRGHLTGIAA